MSAFRMPEFRRHQRRRPVTPLLGFTDDVGAVIVELGANDATAGESIP